MPGVSTILAPFLTPLLTWALAGESINVDVLGMLLSILWVVILPIVVGRLSEPKKRAISIEVGMQNSGLASSLATLHFATYPLATTPGAIFSVWHNISGAIVAYLFRK